MWWRILIRGKRLKSKKEKNQFPYTVVTKLFFMWSEDRKMKYLSNHPIFEILSSYSVIDEFYVCGGYVRNRLLNGDGGKDIDIFINCSPEQLSDLILYLNQYGHTEYGQYGSPRFYPDLDAGHYIDLVPFYNFVVPPTPIRTITELLANFDFTANAIGINIKTGEVFDPIDGTKDIRKKILRAVRLDFPERSVSQSVQLSAVSVFWFRLLHFQRALGFRFDSRTEQWVFENAYRLKDIEMFKQYFFTPQIEEGLYQRLQHCLLQQKH